MTKAINAYTYFPHVSCIEAINKTYILPSINIRGYCVFTPIFIKNCDFTLIFPTFVILPLFYENEERVYPYSVNRT